MMNKMMSLLMLSCVKATELIEKKSVLGLTLKERMKLRVHTSMCDACTAYERQSKILDKVLFHYLFSENSSIPRVINEPLKKRILSSWQ